MKLAHSILTSPIYKTANIQTQPTCTYYHTLLRYPTTIPQQLQHTLRCVDPRISIHSGRGRRVALEEVGTGHECPLGDAQNSFWPRGLVGVGEGGQDLGLLRVAVTPK